MQAKEVPLTNSRNKDTRRASLALLKLFQKQSLLSHGYFGPGKHLLKQRDRFLFKIIWGEQIITSNTKICKLHDLASH